MRSMCVLCRECNEHMFNHLHPRGLLPGLCGAPNDNDGESDDSISNVDQVSEEVEPVGLEKSFNRQETIQDSCGLRLI